MSSHYPIKLICAWKDDSTAFCSPLELFSQVPDQKEVVFESRDLLNMCAIAMGGCNRLQFGQNKERNIIIFHELGKFFIIKVFVFPVHQKFFNFNLIILQANHVFGDVNIFLISHQNQVDSLLC